MAKIFGKRSEYLIRMDYLYRAAATFCYFALIFLIYKFLNINLIGKNSLSIGFIVAVIIYALVFYYVRNEFDKYNFQSFKFKIGRNGEYEVCDELVKLPDDYFIYRNIHCGYDWDFDIIVMGPTGIFAIEVKGHKGNIYLKNNELERNFLSLGKYVSKAKSRALTLREYLSRNTKLESIFVNAVIVFSNDKTNLKFASNDVDNIQIVKKESINDLILSGNEIITPEKISIIRSELDKLI